jgi:hypothetical protein
MYNTPLSEREGFQAMSFGGKNLNKVKRGGRERRRKTINRWENGEYI